MQGRPLDPYRAANLLDRGEKSQALCPTMSNFIGDYAEKVHGARSLNNPHFRAESIAADSSTWSGRQSGTAHRGAARIFQGLCVNVAMPSTAAAVRNSRITAADTVRGKRT